jgi:2,3-bisphosphoglycerate-dependent phosphoglycerate mutase
MSDAMYKLVMMRHGESAWNRENRFTGWTDVDLTESGVDEARRAGRLLKERGYSFDFTFTSVLKRAVKTLNTTLDELDLLWLPTEKHWRLNERHYGALQGLDKSETAARFGDAQVLICAAPTPSPPIRCTLTIRAIHASTRAMPAFHRKTCRRPNA